MSEENQSPIPEAHSLFDSEPFGAWYAINYLFQRRDTDVQEFVCRHLSRRSDSEIEFFLPQLAYVTVGICDVTHVEKKFCCIS